MRALKFSLISLVFCSAVYLLMLLLGPTVITKIIGPMISQFVRFESVKVLPNLNLEVRQLKYLLDGNLGVTFNRVRTDWELFSGQPKLTIDAQSVALNDFEAGSMRIEITPGSEFEELPFRLNFQLQNLRWADSITSDSLSGSAHTSTKLDQFKKVVLESPQTKAFTEPPLDLSKISAELGAISTANGSVKFVENGLFAIGGLDLNDQGIRVSDISGSFSWNEQKMVLETDFPNLTAFNGLLEARNVGSSISISEDSSGIFTRLDSDVTELEYFDIIFQDVHAGLVLSDSFFDADLSGRMSESEFEINNIYVGQFPEGKINISGRCEFLIDKHLSSLTGRYAPFNKVDLDLSVMTEFEAQSASGNRFTDLYSCISQINNLQSKLRLGPNHLKVSSTCSEVPCRSDNIEHVLMTTNTEEFLEDLARTKIINPLVLAFLAIEIYKGTQNGSGHTRHLSP